MMSDGMMHCFWNLEAMGMEDLIYMMLNTLVTKHNTVEHPIATRPCYTEPAPQDTQISRPLRNSLLDPKTQP